jgi:DNA ligase-1
MIKKPMLAATCEDRATLKFPLLATPKLDGIRCLVIDGKAVSRKFKPIPNHYVRGIIEQNCATGMDGEIICPWKSFNETQSLIMTEDGEPDFKFFVFDWACGASGSLACPYRARMQDLAAFFVSGSADGDQPVDSRIEGLFPVVVENEAVLAKIEQNHLNSGYEGVMVRTPESPYKCGRSTVKEGFLLKIKRFADAEAIVIGFEERLTNNNEAQKDELGHTKRSSHKANLAPAGTLGALLVRDLVTGQEFGVGTGLDDAMRAAIWCEREAYLGKIVAYQYQPSGMKERPRFPSFRGFRHEDDLS